MPDEQLFDHYADISALESEKSKVIGIFGDIKAGIKELNQLGLKLSGAGSVKELTAAAKGYQKISDELSKTQDKLAKAEQQLESLRKKAEKPIELVVETKVSASKSTPAENAAKEKKEEEEAAIELAKALEVEEAQRIKNATAVANETQKIEELTGVTKNQRAQVKDNSTAKQTNENAAATVAYQDDLEKLTGTLAQNEQRAAAYSAELQDVSMQIKNLQKNTDNSVKGSQAYQQELGGLLAKQRDIKNASGDLAKTIQLQSTESNAAAGSAEQLKARYDLLTQSIDRLSEAERESDVGKGLIKQAADLNQVITTVEGSSGRFKRNVGNYSGAVQVLEKELANVRKQIAGFNQANAGGSQQFEKLVQEEKLLSSITSQTAKGFASVTQEIRFLDRAMDTLNSAGLKDTEVFKQLSIRYGEAKSKANELNQQQKILASPAPGITALTAAAKGLAGAYAIGAGAAAVFAEGDEKVEKELNKLVAIMTLLQGLQEAHAFLMEKGAIKTALAGTAQKAYNFVVGESTGLLKAFRIASATALTGGLILAIPLLIALFKKYKEAQKDASRETENFEAVQQKASGSVGEVKKTITELTVEITAAKEGYLKSSDVLKHYNETLGKTFGATNDLSKAEKELLEHGDELIQLTFLKAEAQAAGELAAEEAKKSLENQTKSLTKFVDNTEAAHAGLVGALTSIFTGDQTKGLLKATEEGSKIANKNRKHELDENKKQFNSFTELQKTFTKQAIDYAHDHKLNFFGTGNEDKKKVEDFAKDLSKIQADIAKSNLEAQKQRISDAQNADQQIISDEHYGFNLRLQAAQDYYTKTQELSDLNRSYELTANKAAADEDIRATKKKLTDLGRNATVAQKSQIADELLAIARREGAQEVEINAKYNSEAIKNNTDSEKQITGIVESETQRRIKLREEEQQAKVEHQKNVHELDLDQIQHDYDAAEQLLETRFANQEINEKDYNDRKLRLSASLQKDLLQADIAYTADLIDQQKARFKADEDELQHKIDTFRAEAELISDPEEKQKKLNLADDAQHQLVALRIRDNDVIAAADQKLADLQLKLTNLVAKFKIDKGKKTKDDILAEFELIADTAKATIDLVGGFLSAAATNRKNDIQDQIDLLDKQKEADIANANSSIQNAQDREIAISLIEKNAAAKKEALERKQRQIDQDTARFNKAAGIANIIINTAVAVTKFLSKGEVGQAILAAALGAAQLAVAIATPIPKFAEGTESAPGGKALVGDRKDRKPEMVQEPGGKTWIAHNPMIVDLPKGSRVVPLLDNRKIFIQRAKLPDTDLSEHFSQYMSIPKPKFVVNTTVVNSGKDQEILKELQKLNEKPPMYIHIHNQRGIESTPWWDKHMKH